MLPSAGDYVVGGTNNAGRSPIIEREVVMSRQEVAEIRDHLEFRVNVPRKPRIDRDDFAAGAGYLPE